MVIFICEARGAKDLHTAKGARSLTHLNAPMSSLWVRTGSLDWPREGNKGARRGAVQKLYVRRSPKAAMVVLLRGASAALSGSAGWSRSWSVPSQGVWVSQSATQPPGGRFYYSHSRRARSVRLLTLELFFCLFLCLK